MSEKGSDRKVECTVGVYTAAGCVGLTRCQAGVTVAHQTVTTGTASSPAVVERTLRECVAAIAGEVDLPGFAARGETT